VIDAFLHHVHHRPHTLQVYAEVDGVQGEVVPGEESGSTKGALKPLSVSTPCVAVVCGFSFDSRMLQEVGDELRA